MPKPSTIKPRLAKLKKQYDKLRKGKDFLLILIDEAEIPESVYNSNAIENSTLTLKETEKILMEMEVSRNVSLREVFEAKNLAVVSEYIRNNAKKADLNNDLIILLHKMLISNIEDDIAGRYRQKGEYVKVGSHIAPDPKHIQKLMDTLLEGYNTDLESHYLDKITKFHLDFESIHPFNDGNGRMGRLLINFQLRKLGLPNIIIRNKDKKNYYQALKEYDDKDKTENMENIMGLSLLESLHKRITYLKGDKIITVADYAKKHKLNNSALLNAAKRQTIPAFHEKGVWKISAKH